MKPYLYSPNANNLSSAGVNCNLPVLPYPPSPFNSVTIDCGYNSEWKNGAKYWNKVYVFKFSSSFFLK